MGGYGWSEALDLAVSPHHREPAHVDRVSALVEHGTRFYTRKGALISFEAAKAWIWEDDGPSTHASIIDVAELMDPSRGAFLAGPDETWLRPLLARLLIGEDPARLRSDAIAEYRARHGEPPAAHVYDHPLT